MTDVPNPSRATGDAALDGATGGAAIAEAGDGARARTIEQSTSGGLFDNAYLLLTCTSIFWASNFVLGRAVAGHVPPVALGFLRWAVAALILLPFALPRLRAEWPTIKASWRLLVALALLGPGFFNTIAYVGLNYTTALNGLVLQSAGPVMIALTGFLIFGDRIARSAGIGIAISLVGVLVVVGRGDLAFLAQLRPNLGDALILIGFQAWAVYTVLLRKRPDLNWLTFSFVLAVVAAMVNLPFTIREHLAGQQLVFDGPTVAAALFVAIFPSILSYRFYNRGVQLIGSNRAGVFLHLVPMFGSLLAIALLGERLEGFHVAGFALILGGVSLAARQPRIAAATKPRR